MKKFLLLVLVVGVGFYIVGCGKKQSAEEAQEALSMEALTAPANATMATSEKKAVEVTAPPAIVSPAVSSTDTKLAPLPPSGPFKPTNQEIQAALKNAGFYSGEADGKIGPKTKKAIEEFQKANNLKADGKVGPKTWAALSQHLNTAEGVSKKR